MDRGLVIGRFQPVHNGHLHLMEEASEDVDELIAVVGSPTQSYSKKNPFTAGERIEMIKKLESELEISLLPIPAEDKDHNGIWVNHIESLCPSFDKVFAGNKLVQTLFKDAGYEVVEPYMKDRQLYRGEVIREKMIEGDNNIEHLVPLDVVSFIHEIDGIERLQVVSQSDY